MEDRSHDDAGSRENVLDLCSQNLAELNGQLLTVQNHTITVLKLNFNNLSSLPHSFAQCVPNLKVLLANGNSLTQLPSNFGSLTSLTVLELNDNELTCLPDSVKHLIKLERLQLTGNQLSSLPEDFGEMIHLEELALDENQLKKFPPTFALLDKLRILEVSYNKLCILPKFLSNMSSLTHFCISDNKLEALPHSFSELNQLVIVDVSSNVLKTLPDRFSSQNTLKKFFAGHNQLIAIPDWIGHLPEVTVLCLKENAIGGDCFPADFGKVCKKLQHLDLSGSNVTSLPESFGELESLEWAHFGSNLQDLERRPDYINGNWLSSIPDSFPELLNLSMLRLDENNLSSLPEEFGSLCSLEYLNLDQNLLHELPESFGKLHKLRVCMLSQNSIQLLPSTIGHLTSLEKLLLNLNQLEELPESFKELTQLKTLDLADNKLTELPPFLKSFDKLKMLNLDRNPLKMLKRLVPSISDVQRYKPRSENPQRTWRGRKQLGTIDIEPVRIVPLEGEGDCDEEMADEPVDELYSPEDLPYSFRFEHSPDISVLTAKHTSSTSFCPCDEDTSSRIEPVTSSKVDESSGGMSYSNEESDSLQDCDDSYQDETPEEISSLFLHNMENSASPAIDSEDEDWDSCPPTVRANQASEENSPSGAADSIYNEEPAPVLPEQKARCNFTPPPYTPCCITGEDWDSCPPTVPANQASEEYSPPGATNIIYNEEPATVLPEQKSGCSFTPPPYTPCSITDEDWEADSYSQSAYPPLCSQTTLRSKRRSYRDSLRDFFQLPSLYHAPRIDRPLIKSVYEPPEPKEGQFSDDVTQSEGWNPCESSPPAPRNPATGCVLIPDDLHAPRIRRPKFERNYIEPAIVTGQFSNAD